MRRVKRRSSPISTPPPAVGLDDDIQPNAVTLLFRDFVLPVYGMCNGWLNFLPGLYGQSSPGSVLHLAVSAVAYANFAMRRERKDAEIYPYNVIRKFSVLSTTP